MFRLYWTSFGSQLFYLQTSYPIIKKSCRIQVLFYHGKLTRNFFNYIILSIFSRIHILGFEFSRKFLENWIYNFDVDIIVGKIVVGLFERVSREIWVITTCFFRCVARCDEGFFVENDKCRACSPNCKTCSKAEQCTTCPGAMFLIDVDHYGHLDHGQCVKKCPAELEPDCTFFCIFIYIFCILKVLFTIHKNSFQIFIYNLAWG